MLHVMIKQHIIKSATTPEKSWSPLFKHRYSLSKYFYPVVFIFIIIYNLL